MSSKPIVVDLEVSRGRKASPVDSQIGARLRFRRQMLGWSQETLGQRMGVTFQQVQKYENGVNRIGAGRLFELSKILEVSVPYFFGDNQGASTIDANGDAAVPRPHEPPDMLHAADSRRLLQAFAAITDPRRRRALVALAQSMANDAGAEGQSLELKE
jgi:transcriptional regulator with XRE-family HTH domain